jgi:hypothetical protein
MTALGKPLQDRVTISCSDGGHTMYTVRESHQKLKTDMAKFITAHERARAPARALTPVVGTPPRAPRR